MFRDVPECSVFLILSTACAISSEYKSVSTHTHASPLYDEISAGSVFLGTGHYLCGGRGGGGGGNSWSGPGLCFLEKRGVSKENFRMIGSVGHYVFCNESHSLQFMWKI